VKAEVCSLPLNTEYNIPEKARYPITDISWFYADTFCRWNDRNGHLPTEAEWEKAARGTDGRTYPWGEGIDATFANFNNPSPNNAFSVTIRVGSFEKGRSPYGAYDMAGNAFEWVADWYDTNYYENSPTTNPTGAQSGDFKLLRGGSGGSSAYGVSTSFRAWNSPFTTRNYIGFRCARDRSP